MEFLLHGLRIMFSFIGTFLTISMSITILGMEIEKFLHKYKVIKYINIGDIWLWIGITIALLLIPIYYIP